jgi:protein arginine kinase activator
MNICPVTNQPCLLAKTTHVTEIKNGKIVEIHLCSSCESPFIKPEIEPDSQISKISNNLLSFLQSILSQPLLGGVQQDPCPNCGTTSLDITKTGRFGCSECYTHFKKGLKHVLSSCQAGAIKHVGKIPKKWAEKREQNIDKIEQIKNLKAKMQKAIEVENYEVANILKKKIEELG